MRTERPTVTVVTPARKKPGPRSLSPTEEPSVDVHLTLAPADYDAAFQRAQRERVSVPEVLRRALRGYLNGH